MAIEAPEFNKNPLDIDKNFWGPLANVVKDQYSKKIPKFELVADKLSESENWDNLRSVLKETLMPPYKIKNCLEQAGAAHQISDIRINNKSIKGERFDRHRKRFF